MKKNKVFDLNRFIQLFRYNFLLKRKYFILVMIVLALICFLNTFISIANAHRFGRDNWDVLFAVSAALTGLIYIGSSFPAFRRKESTQTALLLPASTTEKFAFEFLVRILFFILLFPLIFAVFSHLAVLSIEWIPTKKPFEISAFTGMTLFTAQSEEQKFEVKLLFLLFIFGYSLSFAGAAALKKYPLVKTALFVTTIIAAIGGYLYLIIEKAEVNYPWMRLIMEGKDDSFLITPLFWFLSIATLVALSYAFFKLKEKEV